MSETAKVRLVRCPKCENLLPEVTDFSVYQCGGCGAVLRAKNKGVDLDTFSEKSEEERIGGNLEKTCDRYDKMMNVSDRRMMDQMSDGSESDVRSTISSSSRAERRRASRERAEISRAGGLNREENWEVEVDVMRDRRSDEIQRVKMTQDFEDLVMHRDNEGGLRRHGRMGEKGEMEGVWRAQRRAKEGSFDHQSASSYDFEDPARNRSDVDGVNNVEFVGDDRAELLRQLEVLQDKINRSGNLNVKGKERVPVDRRMPPQDAYVSENQMMMMQNAYPDAQFKRPPFHNQYVEPPPLMRRQEMGDNGFYPPQYGPSHVQGYGNPSRSQNHRRGPLEAQASYEMPPARAYVSGPYMDERMAYMDAMDPYPSNVGRHHPSCSCYHCRVRRQVSTPIMPPAYISKYSNVSDDMISNYGDNPGPFGSRDYNWRVPDPPPLRAHSAAQSHTRWPSDVNSEVDGFIRRRPLRPHLAAGVKHCCPIAGGAPFLTCNNCCELLLLPKKVLNKNGSRKKLRCGACSSVIAFVVSGKSLVVSFDVEAKNSPLKVDSKRDVPSTLADSHPSQTRTTFSSEDYDTSGYDFHSMDKEVVQPAARQGRDNKSTETRNRQSASTYASEAEEESNARKDTSTADLSRDDKGPTPPAGSSLQDYFEYSNKFKVAKDSGVGNRSGRSEHDTDRVFPSKSVAGQFLRKESTATEIDIPSNEFNNTGSTFESSEPTRGGRGSIFAGMMGTFKGSHRSEESVKQDNATVTVNGHLISDRLIKKAEKLAGPIQPGHYWYDFRAGFWGAIGGPCLGIIPPFIEEFNYPMPEHCAGGNTSIFVNGRELNHKDLNLLGSRGLPRDSDRSYIIEISGRVLDEETGEELESLGKLAPTMERAKRGFGMRIPQAVA